MTVVIQGSSRGSDGVGDFHSESCLWGSAMSAMLGGAFTKGPGRLKCSLKAERLRGHADPYTIKEVRDGRIELNPNNLTFLFTSVISNVFSTHIFASK